MSESDNHEVTIYVEGRPYAVRKEDNLLNACLSLGFDIPYFCWHPALHSVGACRLCAVKLFKDEDDRNGKIVMSCMTPARQGARISIYDPEVVSFRKAVIEWLMVNHPHDCPVCDEGGECHLQDMTVMTGHVHRRFRFKKRTYRNQYLGPFVNHEMNRCIQCYRCVRFYRDYAGGRDFEVLGSHNHVYYGRHEDGPLQSEFSGNLVEVCPTGVFTDATLKKHYARKWDLQTAPTVCVHCGLGCNSITGERRGMLRRVLNRYNPEVNGHFICDRGRFGYEFANEAARVREITFRPVEYSWRRDIQQKRVTHEEAFARLKGILHYGARVIGIGSPRASLEANFALRTLVGPENFYAGMPEPEYDLLSAVLEALQKGPAAAASLNGAALADAVLILGEDLTNVAPMLDLSVRQSVRCRQIEEAKKNGVAEWDDYAVRLFAQDEQRPLFIASPSATKLDPLAMLTRRASPPDLARFAFALAHAVDSDAPAPRGLHKEARQLVHVVAETLMQAVRPLVISGTSCGSPELIHAAANIAWALCRAQRRASLCFTVPECNSIGLRVMGHSMEQAFKAVRSGAIDAVIVLENDLYRRFDAEKLDEFFNKLRHVVVMDHYHNPTAGRADILLPAATYAEADGTFINNEGRAQRSFRVFVPDGDVQESWRWIRDLLHAAGRPEGKQWRTFDHVTEAAAQAIGLLSPIGNASPTADFRVRGMRIPRQTHRQSGRTAVYANMTVNEPPPQEDLDSPLSFSMEGHQGQPPQGLTTRYWKPGWNSVQALYVFRREAAGYQHWAEMGRRLIEPAASGTPKYYEDIPEAYVAQKGQFLCVALWHIFGSEELSSLAPGIASRMPEPYLALNPADAQANGITDKASVQCTLGTVTLTLTAKTVASLPRGIAGIPSGLREFAIPPLPAWLILNAVRLKQGL